MRKQLDPFVQTSSDEACGHLYICFRKENIQMGDGLRFIRCWPKAITVKTLVFVLRK